MLESVDIFPSSFQFSIKSNKGHKTKQGGILTVIIFLTGLSYLIFLIYNYYSGNIYPKITNMQVDSKENVHKEIKLSKSPLIFDLQFLINGTSVNRSFYSIFLTYIDEKEAPKNIKTTDCQEYYNNKFPPTSQCIDVSDQSYLKPNTNIIIQITKCIKDVSPIQCQNDTDIDNLFQYNSIILNLISKEINYDTIKQTQTDKYNYKSYFLDSQTGLISLARITPKIQNIDKGLLFTTEEIYSSFTEISQDMFQINRVSAMDKFNPNNTYSRQLLIYINLHINNAIQYEFIQYAKFAELLAQFGSIMTLLLYLGFIGQLISQEQILEILSKNLLDNYYNDKFNKQFGISRFKKFIHFITQMSFLKKKSKKTLNEQIHLLLTQKAENLSEITYFTKELLLLKTAVQLLYEVFFIYFNKFKPFQWRILKYCKRQIFKQDNQMEYKVSNHLQLIEMEENFLDNQNQLQESDEIKNNEINKFFDQCEDNSLNRKIISCLDRADQKYILKNNNQ